MKLSGNWCRTFCVAVLLVASCAEPPQYSNVPSIVFDNIIFKDISDSSLPDSLIVSVRFKDGDGDLGLDATETGTGSPYTDKTYGFLPDGSSITYKTKRTNKSYDTLPAFVKPYNCINWEIKTVATNKVDTFYFQLSPNHYNIFVDFFVLDKNGDGNYTEFDWVKEFAYPNCGISFDGRFPILSKDLSQKAPLDGTIRYGMTSTGFLILFGNQTLKLKITIQDRALNKSNTVETQPFTLHQIQKSG